MTQKNDSISGTDTASLLAVSSELLSIVNIITLPAEANYSYQEFLNVLLHAATSPTDSLESASNDLKSKIPNTKIPSADTIFKLKIEVLEVQPIKMGKQRNSSTKSILKFLKR